VGAQPKSVTVYETGVGPDGAFCPIHGFHVGGSFFGVQRGFVSEEAIPPAEGTHDSDLGPWIVFLWMGRAIASAVHSLAAL
jgi:hypothetical protein